MGLRTDSHIIRLVFSVILNYPNAIRADLHPMMGSLTPFKAYFFQEQNKKSGLSKWLVWFSGSIQLDKIDEWNLTKRIYQISAVFHADPGVACKEILSHITLIVCIYIRPQGNVKSLLNIFSMLGIFPLYFFFYKGLTFHHGMSV